MTKPITIKSYAQEYLDLATKLSRGETVTFTHRDKKVLMNMRLMFYGFRAAVKHDNAEAMFPGLEQITSEIEPTAEGVWRIRFVHVDKTDVASVIRDQLSPEPLIPVEAPIASEDVAAEVKSTKSASEELLEQMYGKKPTA